ncbi:type II toxin-antitoxin system HicB family antitoxin [Halobacteriales archaeon Cl-PHB]
MASTTGDEDGADVRREIHLTQEGEWWVAKDVETGVASQGESREEALEMLDEAVALHKGEIGESIDTPEEEREALREMGIDPDEVEAAREEHDELPEFMQ